MKSIQTLCLIYKHPKILLGMKKRGFGAGRWNGFGGKMNEGESVEDGARREMLEEASVNILALDKVGMLRFDFEGKSESEIEAHIFRVIDFTGEPQETEEMTPRWFDVRSIPFDSMWPDDRYWMPLFLEGKRFSGSFLFDKEGKSVIGHDIKEVQGFI